MSVLTRLLQRWDRDVLQALQVLGGAASEDQIYRTFGCGSWLRSFTWFHYCFLPRLVQRGYLTRTVQQLVQAQPMGDPSPPRPGGTITVYTMTEAGKRALAALP